MVLLNQTPRLILQELLQEVGLVELSLLRHVASVTRPNSKLLKRFKWLSSLLFVVVVRTVTLIAHTFNAQLALLSAVLARVVLQFFPAVAAPAAVLQVAPVFVGFGVFASFPLVALNNFIIKQVRRPSVVLPVVRVQTEIALVLFVTERTPHRFEVEEVEVHVQLHFLEHGHGELRLRMGERTEGTILTTLNIVWIRRAVLGLVLFWVVEVLNAIVSPDACVADLAIFFPTANLVAQF